MRLYDSCEMQLTDSIVYESFIYIFFNKKQFFIFKLIEKNILLKNVTLTCLFFTS